jgi:hypothetical protein
MRFHLNWPSGSPASRIKRRVLSCVPSEVYTNGELPSDLDIRDDAELGSMLDSAPVEPRDCISTFRSVAGLVALDLVFLT